MNAQTRLSPVPCNKTVSDDTAPSGGDFLDSGLYGATSATDQSDPTVTTGAHPSGALAADGAGSAGDGPPYGIPAGAAAGPAAWKAAVRPTAWLAAGVVVGAVVVAAWHSSATGTAATNPTAVQGQFPNGQVPNGQGPGAPIPNGQLPNGQVPNGVPGFGGPGQGGRAGEQHVYGTVTGVGSSSVTVRLASGGTATYAVIASSDIVKNGARVSLGEIKVGDTVFLHVYPSNGRTVIEHLFAGDLANPGSSTTKT